MSTEERRKLGIAGCLLALVLPFCVVTIPPMTDLPQQTAQIRLLGEAIGNAEYRIGWWHPNKLGYAPVGIAFLLTAPLDAEIHAPRLGAVLIVLAWFVAVFSVAHLKSRALSSAALALLFVWNHSLYWGFLNFLVGFPLFLWWITLSSDREEGRRATLLTALVALLLYSAHILWLAVALVQLALETLFVRRDPGLFLRRLLPAGPVLLLVALWAPSFFNSGVDGRTFYGPMPWERLQPSWIITSALGGVRGVLEPALLIAVALWLVAGLVQHRGQGLDLRLLRAGLLLSCLAFFLPSVHQHTILFASRWLPAACALLVLALPGPTGPTARTSAALPAGLAAALWLTVSLTTSALWIGYEREELQGLRPALEALGSVDGANRLLGLDFVRESTRIRGFPYYHLPAYAQLLHGGELARSFADEASSLVSWTTLPRQDPWTPRLDWKPEGLRHSDLDHFDALIVHGDEQLHQRFRADPRLQPLGDALPWRLYTLRRTP